MENLYNVKLFYSFDDLKHKYDLLKTQVWRYLQLRHLLQDTFGQHSPRSSEEFTRLLKIMGKGHETAEYFKILMKYGRDEERYRLMSQGDRFGGFF